MSTIEAQHQHRLDSFDTKKDEIDYLLDIANVLQSYGEQDVDVVETTTQDEDDESTEHHLGRLNTFVKVVGTQNKGSLYKQYMEIVDNTPCEEPNQINSYICTKCDTHKLALQNDSYMICPTCGESDIYFDSGTQGMSYDQEINSEVNTSFAYKRINHFNEWLAQFQAKESTSIPKEIIENVHNEFKKSRIKQKDITQTRVKSFLKKLGFNKFYEHVPQITNLLNGIKPPTMTLALEEKLRTMFRDIQVPFELHKPASRSNFLSYSYCLYKFCELLEKDEFLPCFQLLKSREKLYQQDCIWKKICADMNWEFIPTV